MANHDDCALCGGRGYVSDGQIEDGMMTGRMSCPGPFVRPDTDDDETEVLADAE